MSLPVNNNSNPINPDVYNTLSSSTDASASTSSDSVVSNSGTSESVLWNMQS